MRLDTDDAIHRFQGRWIDARGTALPVVARYWAWGLFVLFAPPLAGLTWLAVHDPVISIGLGLGLGAMAAGQAADHIGSEYTIRSWLMVATSEIASWRRGRNARRQNTTPHRATPTK